MTLSRNIFNKSAKIALESVEFSQQSVFSYPSRLVYSADVPEVTNLTSAFIYNFFTTDESTRDNNILQNLRVKLRIDNDLIVGSSNRKNYDYTDAELIENRDKFPRYIKVSFNRPKKIEIKVANNGVVSAYNSKIINEENFSGNYYTSLQFNNSSLEKATSVNHSSNFSSKSSITKEAEPVNPDSPPPLSGQPLIKGTIFRNNGGAVIKNSYLESLKKLSTSTQISNNVVDSLVIDAAGNPLTLNQQSFQTLLPDAAKAGSLLPPYEFKTNVDYYEIISADNNVAGVSDSTVRLVGYVIEKSEIFPDGSKLQKETIVIENPSKTSFVDFNVRYGTLYSYSIRSVVDVQYSAVNNVNYNTSTVKSLIASRPVVTVVETTENVGPPPPTELKFMWNYDRINPLTMQYDSVTNAPYPNTGKYGSLFLYWTFPINSQLDIKYFQVFRRKSVDEPFELIKMYDFNDADIKFPLLEDEINPALIEKTATPKKSYYDDEFMKDSEYIYALACIDAHGLTSNYSEQFKVKFDSYKNKIIVTAISIAGAPKQYPNLYLAEDMFIDSIKTSNKKTIHAYFTPDCYEVQGTSNKVKLFKSEMESTKYKINFINIDNQDNVALDIKIIKSS
jgi:hypothetical protein